MKILDFEESEVLVNAPAILSEYGLSELTLTKIKYNFVVLNRIVVADRKRGNGTRFMSKLIREADEAGVILALTADASLGATSENRLKRFYKRFGFKENKGRHVMLTVNEGMVRVPSTEDWAFLLFLWPDSQYVMGIPDAVLVNPCGSGDDDDYNTELESAYLVPEASVPRRLKGPYDVRYQRIGLPDSQDYHGNEENLFDYESNVYVIAGV